LSSFIEILPLSTKYRVTQNILRLTFDLWP